MTIQEFAKMLDSREKGDVLTEDEQKMIKKLGWCISFGQFNGNLDGITKDKLEAFSDYEGPFETIEQLIGAMEEEMSCWEPEGEEVK